MIYFTSDLHFCHNKEFIYEARGFDTVQEMNEVIVKNWNEQVDTEDEVYCLGDLMLCDNEEGARLLHQLNGHIHIVLGNHDTSSRIEIYKNSYNVVEVEYGLPFRYNGYHFFLSHYPTITSNFDNEKPLKLQCINLCGHSHTFDPFENWDLGNIYHVELDAHNNKPISIDEIIQDIVKKRLK